LAVLNAALAVLYAELAAPYDELTDVAAAFAKELAAARELST